MSVTTSFGLAAAIGVLLAVAGPVARMRSPRPECHQRHDPCHEARGVGSLSSDCGASAGPLSALTHRPVVASYPMNARGSSPLVIRAAPIDGREGPEAMTRTNDNEAARRRDDRARERGSRPFGRRIRNKVVTRRWRTAAQPAETGTAPTPWPTVCGSERETGS